MTSLMDVWLDLTWPRKCWRWIPIVYKWVSNNSVIEVADNEYIQGSEGWWQEKIVNVNESM